ncbi:amino acid ABC transporter permease (plasmid) [Variovorax sp. V213]|uniref:amino acid ABC transporter permease n=1 Tax=Variovorax sp. V213 TaxID=3065955 RepID=UPI0034E89144
MNYDWNWRVFLEQSPNGGGAYGYLLAVGLANTVAATLLIFMLALALGTAVGVLRTLPSRKAQAAGRVYVEVFRNIPLIVQLFIWYFVLPELLPRALGDWIKQWEAAPFFAVVIGIGCYMAARVGEQLRSGIQALARGQQLAASALGMTLSQSYRYVLLPRAFRIIWPMLTSDAMGTVKATSIGLTIGFVELTAQAHSMQEFSFRVFEAFLAALTIYVILNFLIVTVMRRFERRLELPGFGGK